MSEDAERDGEGAAAARPLASSSPAPVGLLNKRPVRIYLKDRSVFKRPVRIYLNDRSVFI